MAQYRIVDLNQLGGKKKHSLWSCAYVAQVKTWFGWKNICPVEKFDVSAIFPEERHKDARIKRLEKIIKDHADETQGVIAVYETGKGNLS